MVPFNHCTIYHVKVLLVFFSSNNVAITIDRLILANSYFRSCTNIKKLILRRSNFIYQNHLGGRLIMACLDMMTILYYLTRTDTGLELEPETIPLSYKAIHHNFLQLSVACNTVVQLERKIIKNS